MAQECQAEACAIQSCLSKNNYNESRCAAAVKDLYACCAAMYARAEAAGEIKEGAKSESCPIPSVVARKMKQFGKEA
ncbi:Cx9C motif-containing protein 4, mitochondrial [Vanrija pseudolonga]|uniref:Cx9C motif-containing protein 4, mitochondrial n=1 Tax=Vanrija pseudolonga TaxID=143232 RepID=A0AAF0Y503_9TREE|nr:Cx9C motif-containing protein 4, mitochondrial [Vanrija pseudolonga]